jgi:DNA-binding MurR/RpiR family transcriptional regulator
LTKRTKEQTDLFSKIRALERLTPAEKKITVFFENNSKILAFDSLTALSSKAKVSKASMIRFLIHRLGYRDFAEFKAERQEYLEKQLESPINRYFRQQGKGQGSPLVGSPFQGYIKETMDHLQALGASLRQETLELASGMLGRTDRSLFILGQHTSFTLAYMLATNLQYIRPQVFLMKDDHSSMPTELFQARPGDVAFVISRRRYSKNTHNLTRYMHEAGLSIVLATDSETSPLASLAEVLLVIPSSDSARFESLVSWVAMIEMLALMVADRCHDSEKEYAKKADDILKQFYGLVTKRP